MDEGAVGGLERCVSSGGSSTPYSWASRVRRHDRSSMLIGEGIMVERVVPYVEGGIRERNAFGGQQAFNLTLEGAPRSRVQCSG